MHEFLRRLGVAFPIMQAPMGGGPSTPELVAAVSGAGGMGWLAAAYLTSEQIAEAVAKVRRLTDRPFGINLFTGGWNRAATEETGPMLKLLGRVHGELGLPPPVLTAVPEDPYPAQLEAVLAARPAAFSFTFGIPSSVDLGRLKDAGILILGTATTCAEGKLLAAAGVDGIVAQGAEAGAHRGTFAGRFEDSLVPTLELTTGIAQATGVPVLASGGLMDGRDVAAALRAGAAAVSLGTAFLASPESGAAEAYKSAVLGASAGTTVITRAFSGRPARGLKNEFIASVDDTGLPIPLYPLQNALTRPMRIEAAKRGDPRWLSLWAGTGVSRARALPAAELVAVLLREMEQLQTD